MRAQLLLADYAQVAEGKLNIIGAGWTFTGPGPSTFALGLLLEVPWDATNVDHEVVLRLVDQDGGPVLDPSGAPLIVLTTFQVGRPPGVPAGVSQSVPLAVNFPSLQLPPGTRFEWVLSIDGASEAEWNVSFATRVAEAEA
ncbi:MAG: hypothetical protein WKF43_06105 [Acidimicrobiales bacterium]